MATRADAEKPDAEKPDAEPAPLSAMDRRVKQRVFTPQRIAAAAGAALLIGLMAFGYWRYGLTRSLSVAAERVTVSAVQYDLFREYIPITGNTVPAQTVYLDAVEGGQVTRIHVEEGQMVEEGEPLLELKNTSLQLSLVEAETRLTEQVTQLNTRRLQAEQSELRSQEQLIGFARDIANLERELERSERLLAVDAIALSRVQDMRTNLDTLKKLQETATQTQRLNREMQDTQNDQLQASIDAISATLEVARENLENLVMRAPISGQLTVFEANIGEAKSPGQDIGQIDDVGAFKVTAMVDEFYIGRVAIGQTASVEIGGRPTALEVTKVYPDVRDRQFQIDLEFAEAEPEGLRRGQTLRMNLEIGAESESLVLANGPWVDETGGAWAFVMASDGGSAFRRDISIGRRNPDMVEVVSGLSDGERVITSGYDQLKDFDRIDVRGLP